MEKRFTNGWILSTDTTVIPWATKLTPGNESGQTQTSICDTMTLIPATTVIIIALVGLAGNAIVLWFLGFCLQRNTFSVYILNLAGADFLFLCCQIICSLTELITYFHSVSIGIPRFFITVSIFAYIAGLSFLSAISTERCLSVLCPIWYRCRRPRHMSAVTCALLWALSLLLSILEGNYCGFLIGDFHPSWCPMFDFITVAWLIFLFVFLSGSSLALLTGLLCGSQWMQLTRLYVAIILTVLVFLLCGLPFGLKWFLLYWIHDSCSTLLNFLNKTGVILSSLNSSANPIIYFFVGSFRQQWQLRQALKVVLQRALEDLTEMRKSGGSLPQETRETLGSSSCSDSVSSRVQSEK